MTTGLEISIVTTRFRLPGAALAIVCALVTPSGRAVAAAPVDEAGPARAEDRDEGRQHGNASFYAKHLAGRKTASGERYDPEALTAAHRSLPMGTRLRVTNARNDKSVVVTVNDRGHLPKNRVVDVSSAAADALDMKKSGVTRVVTRIEPRLEPRLESRGDAREEPRIIGKGAASPEPAR